MGAMGDHGKKAERIMKNTAYQLPRDALLEGIGMAILEVAHQLAGIRQEVSKIRELLERVASQK